MGLAASQGADLFDEPLNGFAHRGNEGALVTGRRRRELVQNDHEQHVRERLTRKPTRARETG